jgi:hypothetical protein
LWIPDFCKIFKTQLKSRVNFTQIIMWKYKLECFFFLFNLPQKLLFFTTNYLLLQFISFNTLWCDEWKMSETKHKIQSCDVKIKNSIECLYTTCIAFHSICESHHHSKLKIYSVCQMYFFNMLKLEHDINLKSTKFNVLTFSPHHRWKNFRS